MEQQKSVVKETAKLVNETSATLSQVISHTEKSIDEAVAPTRRQIFRKFPVLFLLLIAVGFTATMTGLEQLLLKIAFFRSNPLWLLIIGVLLLLFTGRLYKKLG